MYLKKYWWQITIIALLAVIIAMLTTFIIQQQKIKAVMPLRTEMQQGALVAGPHPMPDQFFEEHLRHELNIDETQIEALRDKRIEFHNNMQDLNSQIAQSERALMHKYMYEDMDSNEIVQAKAELGNLLANRDILRLEYMKLIRQYTDKDKLDKLDSLMDEMMQRNRGKHMHVRGQGMNRPR